jgi:hypothetical protein
MIGIGTPSSQRSAPRAIVASVVSVKTTACLISVPIAHAGSKCDLQVSNACARISLASRIVIIWCNGDDHRALRTRRPGRRDRPDWRRYVTNDVSTAA